MTNMKISHADNSLSLKLTLSHWSIELVFFLNLRAFQVRLFLRNNHHDFHSTVSFVYWHEATHTRSYLSQSTELHDDPHRVFCDHSNQLNDVRVVKLTHCYCKRGKHTHINAFSTYKVSHGLLICQVDTHTHTRVVLHASCRNFSLTLSDVQFLQVLMATGRAGLSCRTHNKEERRNKNERNIKVSEKVYHNVIKICKMLCTHEQNHLTKKKKTLIIN